MATIKQIAEKAGVSRGTVDRVLNNRSGVNEETARRVLEIARLLYYKPNKAGKALAAQKNKFLIGIIVFSRKNPYFDDVIRGFEEKAEELTFYGLEILIKRVPYNHEAQIDAINACVESGVNGIIITPYNDESVISLLNKLIADGIPVITVNSDAEKVNSLAYVGSDYYKSGRASAALMDMMSTGSMNVGIILGDSNILCHSQRYLGFTSRLNGINRFNIITVKENFDDDLKSFEIVSSMLREHPEINALYFTAAGVYGGCKAIKELDRSDILVITHDDVPTTVDMLKEGLITATICQQPRWQGAKSLELMYNYLNDPEILKFKKYFYAELNIKISETL